MCVCVCMLTKCLYTCVCLHHLHPELTPVASGSAQPASHQERSASSPDLTFHRLHQKGVFTNITSHHPSTGIQVLQKRWFKIFTRFKHREITTTKSTKKYFKILTRLQHRQKTTSTILTRSKHWKRVHERCFTTVTIDQQ